VTEEEKEDEQLKDPFAAAKEPDDILARTFTEDEHGFLRCAVQVEHEHEDLGREFFETLKETMSRVELDAM
jgi:hypothetical protein